MFRIFTQVAFGRYGSMNEFLGLMHVPASFATFFPLVAGLACLFAGAVGFILGKRNAIKNAGSLIPRIDPRLEATEQARESAELANMELREAMEQLEQAAGTDRLTGAWNRRRFEEVVTTLMALANRNRDPLSLIMFDLDYFKQINDTHGHNMGDEILKGVADRVRGHLRSSDSLTRWGGEEYLIMAPGTGVLGAQALAEKIRESVASRPFTHEGIVTISLGVAEFLSGESLESWIQRTDEAMYQAKREGRNRVVIRAESSVPGPALSSSLLELRWDIEYECGQKQIDAQHQALFDMSNGLLSFITVGDLGTNFQLHLKLLMAHVAQHFHDEEALLGQMGYARLTEHAKAHKALLLQARGLIAEADSHDLDRNKVLGFLALEFIKGHLLTEDRDFFPLFRRHD
jgi:diguanylate cyclase (GGDEF)-like protein/hemerythrin-like metal-binding protein